MTIQEQIQQIVYRFKREPQLKDKTESMGDGLLLAGRLADESNERSKEARLKAVDIDRRYKDFLLENDLNPGKDPELVDIRQGYETAGERITAIVQETDEKMDRKFETFSEDTNALIVESEAKMDLSIKAFREFTVNIKDFGAVYDDPTFDNMPIISAAQNYIKSNGNGDIYFPDDGVLYVKPFLRIQSGVRLIGANSRPVIRIAPDVTNFYALFLIEYAQNVAIRYLEIDSNKENRSNYDISKSPQILIQLAESSYVDVDKNKLIGNGVWIYAVFTGGEATYSRHLNFNDNHVIWKAGDSTGVAGPPGVDVDNTIIYFDALDYMVSNNQIETKDGVKNMTCIEAHGANATVKDNTINGYRCGIIVWSLVAKVLGDEVIYDNNIKVHHNNFLNVEAGVVIGATSNTEYGTFDITGVDIMDNQILLNPAKFKRGSSRGIQIVIPYRDTPGWGRKIKIANNTIDSVIDLTTYPDPQQVTVFTGIELTSGRLSDISIHDNVVKNISGVGLLLNNGFGEELDVNDSSVYSNTFIDCGRNTNIAFDGFNHRTAITIYRRPATRLNRVQIGQNFIYDTRSSGTYFTRAVNGLLASDEDQVVKTKNRDDWVGRFERPLRLQADISNEYISPNTTATIELTKDICRLTSYSYINNAKPGQGVYIHLPVEADISQDIVTGNWQLYKSSGEVTTGFLRINDDVRRIAWLLYPELKAVDIEQGDRLQISIEFPTDVNQKYTPQ